MGSGLVSGSGDSDGGGNASSACRPGTTPAEAIAAELCQQLNLQDPQESAGPPAVSPTYDVTTTRCSETGVVLSMRTWPGAAKGADGGSGGGCC